MTTSPVPSGLISMYAGRASRLSGDPRGPSLRCAIVQLIEVTRSRPYFDASSGAESNLLAASTVGAHSVDEGLVNQRSGRPRNGGNGLLGIEAADVER